MNASQWHNNINTITIMDARKQWLCDANRLVQAFKAHFGVVVMEMLQEGHHKPFADESAALQLEDKAAHIRQIVIATKTGHRLSYARVVIADDTYEAYAQQFSGLGRQFIGDSLLYNNKEVVRQPFEFACFDDSSLYAQAFFQLVKPAAETQPWLARRSIFLWQNRPLLITEFLLPYLATVPYTNRILTNGESDELQS
ncbi:MAG: chorismate lyase family protein [Gammaproteobacteria bacterium]|nr:chorismate lyase family protein [Gammaproteobacteria bacterium]